ncbi:MAG: hypothetical protein JWO36_3667 [Myxococcales bacterium]|nr:hypothetical protein [Myxococcales bacterium]
MTGTVATRGTYDLEPAETTRALGDGCNVRNLRAARSSDRLRTLRARDRSAVRSFPVLILLVALIAACHSAKPATTQHPGGGGGLRGLASFYNEPQITASGERFDKRKLTAAHRTLPMGTMVRVINQRNGKSVIVRINDRGPYAHGRIIDLSEAAAKIIDMIEAGVVPVVLQVVGR